ncbi:putative conserved membrane protein [Synechococcus sp. SYN20]|nr:putative conserved membrane protein [Synechococcus sp. SYN20]
MQGAFELGLVAILFLGLQVWWLSKVFLNRPRQPRPMGASKPMRANSLQNDRNVLEKIFGKS